MVSIASAFRIVWRALADVWSDLWTALVIDFFWLIANLVVIPGPPATLALFSLANRRAHDELYDLKDFWPAFRCYWGPGWRWGAINLAVLFFLAGDVYLTGRGTVTPLTRFIQGFYFALIALWGIVQLYTLAFLIEQEKPSVRTALRNGAVMLGRNPIFSVCLGIILLVACLVGTVAFLLTLGFGAMFVAAAGNRAVIEQLESTK